MGGRFRRALFHILNALLVVGLSVQVVAGGAEGESYMTQIVVDPQFREGFLLIHPREGVGQGRIVDSLNLGNPAAQPVWRLAQWSSRHSLAGAEVRRLPVGGYEYANEAKRVVVGDPATPVADLILAVYGSVEYGEQARKEGEPWVHLLVEQEFATKPRLSEMKALNFTISAKLNEKELFLTPGYSPNLHAAQFLIYFVVQNLNPRSPGYGDFYWFGVPIYDDRYLVIPRYQSPDFNTSGKYIFTPGSREYTDQVVADGEWITIEKDLLPLMLEGLEDARSKGFLPASGDPLDYAVSGMNMGWEVPGIFNVEMQVRDLSVTAVWNER